MVHFWLILVALISYAGDEPTPLLPHPPNRPNFSQDRYKQQRVPVEEPVAEAPVPSYSQDQFQSKRKEGDYTGELRKVPEKAHEWSEIEIAKGMVELNSDHFDAAEKHFRAAFEKDPRNFIALEYISNVHERKGDLQGAIAELAKAKHLAPEPRWGSLNFQIGRIYLLLKNHERAEIYLKLALDQGGHQTAVHYLIGYLYYLQGRYFEAEYHLHDARMRALRSGAKESEHEMLQAIDYYLGEIYARLGFTRYAIICLRQTEYGESWEVRNGAWRVHSELNHMNYFLTLGLFAQYDSNVILLPSTANLPQTISSQGAAATLLTASGGWQTSPARRWILGVDASFYLNVHFSQDLASYDVLGLFGGVWGEYWNQKDFALKARLDLSDALTNRESLSTYQTVSAPAVSLDYFPFQRWHGEVGFQYRVNHYATDLDSGPDRRSGVTYAAFLRAGVRAPNPRFRPTFGYSFETEATEGDNYHARSHVFSVEADYRLFEKTHVIGVVNYTITDYPDHLIGRSDTISQFRGMLNHILTPHWNLLVDGALSRDSSTDTNFTYNRVTFASGVTYTF